MRSIHVVSHMQRASNADAFLTTSQASKEPLRVQPQIHKDVWLSLILVLYYCSASSLYVDLLLYYELALVE